MGLICGQDVRGPSAERSRPGCWVLERSRPGCMGLVCGQNVRGPGAERSRIGMDRSRPSAERSRNTTQQRKQQHTIEQVDEQVGCFHRPWIQAAEVMVQRDAERGEWALEFARWRRPDCTQPCVRIQRGHMQGDVFNDVGIVVEGVAAVQAGQINQPGEQQHANQQQAPSCNAHPHSPSC